VPPAVSPDLPTDYHRIADRANRASTVGVDMWTTQKKRCPHAHSRNNNSNQSAS
jgi:hypothetical protein